MAQLIIEKTGTQITRTTLESYVGRILIFVENMALMRDIVADDSSGKALSEATRSRHQELRVITAWLYGKLFAEE